MSEPVLETVDRCRERVEAAKAKVLLLSRGDLSGATPADVMASIDADLSFIKSGLRHAETSVRAAAYSASEKAARTSAALVGEPRGQQAGAPRAEIRPGGRPEAPTRRIPGQPVAVTVAAFDVTDVLNGSMSDLIEDGR